MSGRCKLGGTRRAPSRWARLGAVVWSMRTSEGRHGAGVLFHKRLAHRDYLELSREAAVNACGAALALTPSSDVGITPISFLRKGVRHVAALGRPRTVALRRL